MNKPEQDKNIDILSNEIRYLRKEIALLKSQLTAKEEQVSNLIFVNMQLLNIIKK